VSGSGQVSALIIIQPSPFILLQTYSEFRLPHHQTLTPLITYYAQLQHVDPQTSLGPHWQRPGRSILENHLLDVPEANQIVPGEFEAWERVFFAGMSILRCALHSIYCLSLILPLGEHHPSLPSNATRHIILRKKMTWEALLSYFQTWSSLHTYFERYPEDLRNPEGDLSVRFWKQLKGNAAKDDEVVVEWPVAMMLVKKA
jgi:hypothetical protein